MHRPDPRASRREFLRRGAALAATAGSPFAVNLAAVGAAAAQSATDYKALVCVHLHGGNDHANTVVPVDTAAYAAYRAGRGSSLALPAASLLPLQPTGFTGPALGLHPALPNLKALFDQGRCAVLANVGTLCEPVTRAQWNHGRPTVRVPYQLFSHSDQSGQWQTGIPDSAGRTGWQGRMGDLLASANSSPVSICMSVAGNNLAQVGRNVIQYQLTVNGPVRISNLDRIYYANSPVPRALLTEPRSHLLENELNRIATRAIEAEGVVSAAIAPTAAMPAFRGKSLGQQLRMVARMAAAQQALQQRRQIFFVSLGGFDFHSALLANQHARLLELDQALADFQATLDGLGLAQRVTTFTTSDFGRALQSNGDGSDHGWGAHHFILGGAVRGNRIYGLWPTVALDSADDAGQGRLIPTTAVDQYVAELARWFGVSDTDLATVVPNRSRFNTTPLGLL